MARKRRKSSKPVSNSVGLGQGVSPSRIGYSPYPSRASAWDVVSLMQMPKRLANWTVQNQSRMARVNNLLARHNAQVERARQGLETHRAQSSFQLSSDPSPSKKSSDRAREARCKERPDSKKAARTPKGQGGPKRFVPWC